MLSARTSGNGAISTIANAISTISTIANAISTISTIANAISTISNGAMVLMAPLAASNLWPMTLTPHVNLAWHHEHQRQWQ